MQVLTTTETRDELNRIAARFSAEGARANPIVFGSHRKPQAVILPIQVWEMVEDAWDLAQADDLLNRFGDATWMTRDEIDKQLRDK